MARRAVLEHQRMRAAATTMVRPQDPFAAHAMALVTEAHLASVADAAQTAVRSASKRQAASLEAVLDTLGQSIAAYRASRTGVSALVDVGERRSGRPHQARALLAAAAGVALVIVFALIGAQMPRQL